MVVINESKNGYIRYHFILETVLPHSKFYNRSKGKKGVPIPSDIEEGYQKFLHDSNEIPRIRGKAVVYYVTIYDPAKRVFDLDNLDTKGFTDDYIKPYMIINDDITHLSFVMDGVEIGTDSEYPLKDNQSVHTEVFVVQKEDRFWKLQSQE